MKRRKKQLKKKRNSEQGIYGINAKRSRITVRGGSDISTKVKGVD